MMKKKTWISLFATFRDSLFQVGVFFGEEEGYSRIAILEYPQKVFTEFAFRSGYAGEKTCVSGHYDSYTTRR